MTDSIKQKEKLKLALIPLLVICLIGVLTGGNGEGPSTVPELIPPVKQAMTAISSAGLGGKESAADVVWPAYSLTTIMAHNPFELKDPRVMLDADMLEAGITGVERMIEVSATDFFPAGNITDLEAESSFLAALMDWTKPVQDANDAEATEPLADAMFSDTSTLLAEVDSYEPDAEQLALAEQERQMILERERSSLELQQRLAALQTQPVTMIMTTTRGTSALFGGRRITEGELVEQGIRAASIGRQGITFEIVENSMAGADARTD